MNAALPIDRVANRSSSGLDARDIDDVVARLAIFEPQLRDARLLVTGATGWFGTWLLDALVALDRTLALDLRIVAVSRDPGAFARRHPALHRASAITWIAADVREPLRDVQGTFTHVIHAATDASAQVAADDPARLFATIVGGTRHVLALLERHRGARLLLLSSGAVYGPQPAIDALPEVHRGAPDVLDPGSAYAEGKRAAELLAAIDHASRGTAITIARCFAFVGPHMPFSTHFAIGNFIADALDGDCIRIRGDGTPRRSYLYMTDLVVWLMTILIEGRPMRPYNVGAGQGIAIASLARRCAAAAGRAVDVRIESRDRGGRHYVPDVRRAHDELGLQVTVPLDDAIGRTMAWRRRNARSV